MMMITCLILWIAAGTTYVALGPTGGVAACFWLPDVHDASRPDMSSQATAIRTSHEQRRDDLIQAALQAKVCRRDQIAHTAGVSSAARRFLASFVPIGGRASPRTSPYTKAGCIDHQILSSDACAPHRNLGKHLSRPPRPRAVGDSARSATGPAPLYPGRLTGRPRFVCRRHPFGADGRASRAHI